MLCTQMPLLRGLEYKLMLDWNTLDRHKQSLSGECEVGIEPGKLNSTSMHALSAYSLEERAEPQMANL